MDIRDLKIAGCRACGGVPEGHNVRSGGSGLRSHRDLCRILHQRPRPECELLPHAHRRSFAVSHLLLHYGLRVGQYARTARLCFPIFVLSGRPPASLCADM